MESVEKTGAREPWIEPEIAEMSAQESESGKAGKNDHAVGFSYKQTS